MFARNISDSDLDGLTHQGHENRSDYTLNEAHQVRLVPGLHLSQTPASIILSFTKQTKVINLTQFDFRGDNILRYPGSVETYFLPMSLNDKWQIQCRCRQKLGSYYVQGRFHLWKYLVSIDEGIGPEPLQAWATVHKLIRPIGIIRRLTNYPIGIIRDLIA